MEGMDETTDETNDADLELVDEELTEVFRADQLGCQAAIDEVLGPNDIPAMVHNRVSHALPAPASMPGSYYVAVPVGKAPHAIALLREAIEDGALPGGEIPDAKR
jgi:hypothetical protein